MAYRLGVDVGTTFVAAAICCDSQVEMVTLGDRSVVTPSVVYLREDGALITGEAAARRAPNSPDRVAREFKRRLGDPTPVVLADAPHAVTDLLGAVLRDVLATVTETEGAPPERVVLTHPANWGPYRRGLFEEVPRLAGLSDTITTTEPEAAAAHYVATRKLDVGDTVAVYDLGGGTFDVTVLRKQADGVEILGTPEGIERLGGIDFDEAILSHVNFASDRALAELDVRDPKNAVALARLRQDCVLAKESLSVDTETLIPVFLPGRNFDVPITREDFEKLVRAQVESTIGALARTLRSARVQPDELNAVLLVGGSSRIPLVAEMVSEELGRPIVVDTHPKYAVALGAATIAGQDAAPTRASATPPSAPAAAPQPVAPPEQVRPPSPASQPPTPPSQSPRTPQAQRSPAQPRPAAPPGYRPSDQPAASHPRSYSTPPTRGPAGPGRPPQQPGRYPGQRQHPGRYPMQYPAQRPGRYPGQRYPAQQWRPPANRESQPSGSSSSVGRTVLNWSALIVLAVVVAYLAYVLVNNLRGLG